MGDSIIPKQPFVGRLPRSASHLARRIPSRRSLGPGFQRVAVMVLLFFLALIAYQSLVPSSKGPSFSHSDKFMHALAYAIVAGVAIFALPQRTLMQLCVGIVLFGVCIEVGQALLNTGRLASVGDALANAFGAGLVLGLRHLWETRRETTVGGDM